VKRVDPETAYEMLWNDLIRLYREVSGVDPEAPDSDETRIARRFLNEIRLGRRQGKLVGAVDRLMRESAYGAVLNDPRRPDALLETRIVLAPKPYAFLWPQATLDLAHRRARRFGRR
jgi:hypothetical protein